jgi:hypothetical protein
MIKCSRCQKRMAMIFVTKVENGQKKSEGLCMPCAKELGLPVENMLGDAMSKMGLNPEQLSEMEADFKAALGEGAFDGEDVSLDEDAEDGEESEASRKGDHIVPTFDFKKMFEDAGILPTNGSQPPVGGGENKPAPQENAQGEGAKSRDKDKKDKNLDDSFIGKTTVFKDEDFDDFDDLKDDGVGKIIVRILIILIVLGFIAGCVVLANHFLNLGLF